MTTPTAQVETVLRVQDLGKEYLLYDSPGQRLKSMLTGRAAPRRQWALRGVTFELRRGQCLGVIGDNGAGKSTLLKLVAQTMRPSTGQIALDGRVTAILELGAGFHPDFSGRENLHFAGSLMGFTPAQLQALEPSIIDFSELHASIDRPVKTYSSGMVVRLAFALVTAVVPDVLIVDEALAVGDQHFQKKCVDRIEVFREQGCTILFCSHSLYHVRQLCDTALWLDGGEQKACGPTERVLAAYESHVRQQNAATQQAPSAGQPGDAASLAVLAGERRGAIVSVDIPDLDSGAPPRLLARDLQVIVTARVADGEQPQFGVMLEQAHGVGITVVATHVDGAVPQRLADGLWRVAVRFPDLPLHSGEYVVSAYLADTQALVIYDEWHHHQVFAWENPTLLPGLVQLPHTWS